MHLWLYFHELNQAFLFFWNEDAAQNAWAFLGQISRKRRIIIKLIGLFFNFERLGVNWPFKSRLSRWLFCLVWVVTAARALDLFKLGQKAVANLNLNWWKFTAERYLLLLGNICKKHFIPICLLKEIEIIVTWGNREIGRNFTFLLAFFFQAGLLSQENSSMSNISCGWGSFKVNALHTVLWRVFLTGN